MLVELVRTKTRDGIRLDGVLALPLETSSSAPVDAFVLLHGVGGNFYGGSMFDALSASLLAMGTAVLRVNTRGHGSISMLSSDGGPLRGGAAFEMVSQCRYDIEAWSAFLGARGFQRVGLLGHSLGAIKAIYAAAHELPGSVAAIVAASPPRLSCAAFQHGQQSATFLESLATAKQFVKEGRPESLFTARFPFPLLISAASYIDKYGEERYNIEQFVDRVTVPTLFTYGSIELEQGGIAFAGLPAAIGQRAAKHVQVVTIPGADHFYTGKYSELAAAISDWLAAR